MLLGLPLAHYPFCSSVCSWLHGALGLSDLGGSGIRELPDSSLLHCLPLAAQP